MSVDLIRRLRRGRLGAPVPPAAIEEGMAAFRESVRRGRFDEAFTFYLQALRSPLYWKAGRVRDAHDLLLLLFPGGPDDEPRLETPSNRARAIRDLSYLCGHLGRPREALVLIQRAIDLFRELRSSVETAKALISQADDARRLGMLRMATRSLRDARQLAAWIADGPTHVQTTVENARVLAYCRPRKSARLLGRAEEEFESFESTLVPDQTCSRLRQMAWSVAARLFLECGDAYGALVAARRTHDLHGRNTSASARIRDGALLGTAFVAMASSVTEEDPRIRIGHHHLRNALSAAERTGERASRPAIRIGLARCILARGDPAGALPEARHAKSLATRYDQRLDAAEAELLLAEIHATRGEEARPRVRRHARKAIALAQCDGPGYDHRSVIEGAGRLLGE